MNNSIELKKNLSFENIILFLLIVVGISFNWTILRNYSLSIASVAINSGDVLLAVIIIISLTKHKFGGGPSYLSRLLVSLIIATYILGAVGCIININGNISILIRLGRGFFSFLLVCAYSKGFTKIEFLFTLITSSLVSTIALIFYSLNQLKIISYGNFDFIAGGARDEFTSTTVVADNFTRFFFIDFIAIFFCIAICMFIYATANKNNLLKNIASVGIICSYVDLMFNLSRAFSVILLLLSLAMIFNITKYNKSKGISLFGILVSALVIGSCVFWFFQGEAGFIQISEWYRGLVDPTYVSAYSSGEVRLSHFASAFEAFSDSPIFGHGMGTDFTFYHNKFGTLENPYNFGNTLSLRAAQTGLVGLTMWIGFNLILVKHIYLKKSRNREEILLKNTLFLIHISSFVSCLVSGDSTSTLSYGLVYSCIILMADYINRHPLPEF